MKSTSTAPTTAPPVSRTRAPIPAPSTALSPPARIAAARILDTCSGVGVRTVVTACCRSDRARSDELAAVDDHDLVGEVLYLRQQVARYEESVTHLGTLPEQVAHPSDVLVDRVRC